MQKRVFISPYTTCPSQLMKCLHKFPLTLIISAQHRMKLMLGWIQLPFQFLSLFQNQNACIPQGILMKQRKSIAFQCLSPELSL